MSYLSKKKVVVRLPKKTIAGKKAIKGPNKAIFSPKEGIYHLRMRRCKIS